MKKVFVTNVTEKYIPIAINLVKSIRLFSDIDIIVYGIDVESCTLFNEFKNVYFKTLILNLDHDNPLVNDNNNNFYVVRDNIKTFNILSSKIDTMIESLKENYDSFCYLDSDCIATPIIEELFDWSSKVDDYPLATKGIHDYMMLIEDGNVIGNPFEGCWPECDNKLSLEWPLMQFLNLSPSNRGTYRTTNVLLYNKNSNNFLKTWLNLCKTISNISTYFKDSIAKYAPFHEETIYNVLNWKKSNEGFPLCYINIGDGINTTKDFYEVERESNTLVWEESDNLNNRFYKIPEDKKHVKVLHGEKRTEEVEKILTYLSNLNDNGYFK